MSQSHSQRPRPEEVEHLLRNAQLRDELEPYLDEAIERVNVTELPTPVENEFLASMLAWEKAPVVPISQWYEPELVIPRPESLTDEDLHGILWDTIHRLFEQRIVLDFTDHLSDRALYTLIFRDILPSAEKKIDNPRNYLHWDCADAGNDAELWLRYYATDEEREMWADDFKDPLPERETPPFTRDLPRAPF